jgi:hypothetical protein
MPGVEWIILEYIFLGCSILGTLLPGIVYSVPGTHGIVYSVPGTHIKMLQHDPVVV